MTNFNERLITKLLSFGLHNCAYFIMDDAGDEHIVHPPPPVAGDGRPPPPPPALPIPVRRAGGPPLLAPGVAPVLPPGGAPVLPPGGAPVLPPGGAPVLPPGGAPVLPPGGAPVLPHGGAPSAPGLPLLQQQRQQIIAQLRAVNRQIVSLYYDVLNIVFIFRNSMPIYQGELAGAGAAGRGPEGP
uniref:Uncharacterized protein n=1 Tax=Amphimedon queenslandica TaxID=400682 RepID=A0A1X7TTA5_AMPQE